MPIEIAIVDVPMVLLTTSLCFLFIGGFCPYLFLCGQTLKNDGLLSVWFNDEDCLAYVRDAYFLNR